MKIIKVDAIDSTSTFLKDALRNKTINSATCIWAKNQTNGRGQREAKWESESGKNLTFSVYLPVSEHIKKNAFVINLLTTISVYNVLSKLNLVNLKIKWPNDILAANKKIGGILIENNFQKGELQGTIIGIGLNVNQVNFDFLPQASSIKNILGVSFSLEELLNEIITEINRRFKLYVSADFEKVKKEFETILFRNKKPSTFIAEGIEFPGIIQGITNNGKLIVLQEDNIVKEYNLKQIQLKY